MKAAANAETPDPTVPDNSANTAIINNPNNLANDWMQLANNQKMKVYFTVKGLDQKIYVSSYADLKQKVQSLIFLNRIDVNSLEMHIEYQNSDAKNHPYVLINWNKKFLQLDSSRIGADG
ncbi:hypothetical protein [Ligilactobacillus saerimneri]|uniref:hypothetical protein n=1 Tax=Ligilactobacillus saerimneri TaxID=228229 RepID=UPI001EE1AC49|nr:hypothetical protein [Ligilactobacillus saerimneri]